MASKENRPGPKRKEVFQLHPFSGVNSLLVSGRVNGDVLTFMVQACPEQLEELRGCNESPCGGKHCEAFEKNLGNLDFRRDFSGWSSPGVLWKLFKVFRLGKWQRNRFFGSFFCLFVDLSGFGSTSSIGGRMK